jgi:hypothetical protein
MMTDEQLQQQVEPILYSQDASEAIELSHQLKAEPFLSDSAKKVLAQLQFVRMASLSEDDLASLIKENLPAAYSIPEFDLAAKVAWYIEQIQLPNYQASTAKKIKSVLETHQAHIGKAEILVKNQKAQATVGNWIADYNSYPSHDGQKDALSELEYTNKSPNIKKLAPHEVPVLKNLLKLYDYVNRLIVEWDSIPTPKSEAEAFKDFDLYDFIPGIDKNEKDIPETEIELESAPPQPPVMDSVNSAPRPPVVRPIAPMAEPLNPIKLAPPLPLTNSVPPSIRPVSDTNLRAAPAPDPVIRRPQSSGDQSGYTQQVVPKRGIMMDPTNVKIDEEAGRIATTRSQKEVDIQKKLADLRKRNSTK